MDKIDDYSSGLSYPVILENFAHEVLLIGRLESLPRSPIVF
jgi:hypothetical protein